jgi:nucleoside-diphosphate-sugar epimerase
MRIAVTGASGFVGGRLARALAARGHAVIAYGRREEGALRHPLSNYRTWDLRGALDAPPEVDAVVHCAALVGDWGKEQEYADVNVGGTRQVLAAFPAARRVVSVSTSSVYSSGTPHVGVTESHPVGGCRTAYGRTKAESERVTIQARPDAVILRPHIVYGPGDETLVPRLLQTIRRGRLLVPGSGKNRVSVTHVDNLVHAVERAIASGVSGPFNVSDAAPVPMSDLLAILLTRMDNPARPIFVPRAAAWWAAVALETVWPSRRPPRGPVLTRYVVEQLADEHTLDISRAQAELGYAPRWSVLDGALTD